MVATICLNASPQLFNEPHATSTSHHQTNHQLRYYLLVCVIPTTSYASLRISAHQQSACRTAKLSLSNQQYQLYFRNSSKTTIISGPDLLDAHDPQDQDLAVEMEEAGPIQEIDVNKKTRCLFKSYLPMILLFSVLFTFFYFPLDFYCVKK